MMDGAAVAATTESGLLYRAGSNEKRADGRKSVATVEKKRKEMRRRWEKIEDVGRHH